MWNLFPFQNEPLGGLPRQDRPQRPLPTTLGPSLSLLWPKRRNTAKQGRRETQAEPVRGTCHHPEAFSFSTLTSDLQNFSSQATTYLGHKGTVTAVSFLLVVTELLAASPLQITGA